MECLSSGAMFGSFKDSFGYSNLNSSHLSKIDFKSSLFNGIVLSYWDNIVGPRLGHLWLQCEEKCTENSVKYVVTHTLNGELTRQAPPNAVDTKFFIIKERGLMFSSYIFTGISKGAGETLYSLSLLLPFSALKEYMQYQELVDVRMKLLVARLRVLQEKYHNDPDLLSPCMFMFSILDQPWFNCLEIFSTIDEDLLTSIPNFSKCLLSLIDMVSSLHLHGLSSTFSVWDSAFAPGNSSCFSSSFLEKCITSHMETFGSTVVVGKAVEPINLMINTLALFVSPEERCQSRYVTNDKNMEYDPDLFVQGILTKEDDSYQLNPKKILTSRFPTTLINLEKETVSQSSLFAEHCSTRHQFLNLELEYLWNDDEDAPIYPSLGIMHDLKHESKMISDMLSDIQLLPTQDTIRLVYIENFKRLIRRKAVAVIKYIEDLSRFGYERMDSSGLQEVRQQLRLAKDGDFLIVLATAEKLRPNIYMCAMGEGGQNGTEAIYKNVLGCL